MQYQICCVELFVGLFCVVLVCGTRVDACLQLRLLSVCPSACPQPASLPFPSLPPSTFSSVSSPPSACARAPTTTVASTASVASTANVHGDGDGCDLPSVSFFLSFFQYKPPRFPLVLANTRHVCLIRLRPSNLHARFER